MRGPARNLRRKECTSCPHLDDPQGGAGVRVDHRDHAHDFGVDGCQMLASGNVCPIVLVAAQLPLLGASGRGLSTERIQRLGHCEALENKSIQQLLAMQGVQHDSHAVRGVHSNELGRALAPFCTARSPRCTSRGPPGPLGCVARAVHAFPLPP